MRKEFSNVGQRIFELLVIRKMSKTQLANATNISKNAVSNYCNDTRLPDTSSIYLIANVLNTTVEWLLTGEGLKNASSQVDNEKMFFVPSDSDYSDYKKSVCQIDYASVGERFKQARELSGRTLEQAAASAYLKQELLQRIEEESEFSTKDIGPEQVACLAYLYDVDLYWLFSGKTRPPAAILADGVKVYPPYEFMLEQAPVPTAAGLTTTAAADTNLSEDERDLLDTYSYLSTEGRHAAHTFLHFQLSNENLSSSSSLSHDIIKGKLA